MSHHHRHHRHHRKFYKKPRFYVWLATLLVCLFGCYWLLKFNIIPTLFVSIIIEVNIVFLILMWYLLMVRHRKWMHILAYVMAGILCLSNGFLGYSFNATYSAIDTMSEPVQEKGDYVDLDVLNDSLIKTPEDLNGRTIGILKNMPAEQKQPMIDWLSEQNIEYTLKEYDSSLLMARNLKGVAIDAIILYQPYLSIIRGYDGLEEFSEDVRPIHQIQCAATEMPNTSTDVNVTKNPFTVLISGIDNYGSISETGRSDVNMLISVNPTTRSIFILSIPRDYYVEFDCEGVPACPAGKKDKLTHSGMYGVAITEKTLEKLFDTEINYNIRVNFTSVIKIIDALGGVDVHNVDDFTVGKHVFKPGVIHMDGDTALLFSRERYSFEDGDRERGRNQMRVVEAIIQKVLSPAILQSYTSILNVVKDSVQMNLKAEDIAALVNMELSHPTSWNIYTYSVSGGDATDFAPTLGDNAYVMVPNEEDVSHARSDLQAIRSGEVPVYTSPLHS